MSTQQKFDEERLTEQYDTISMLKEQLTEKENELNQVRNETNEPLKKLILPKSGNPKK